MNASVSPYGPAVSTPIDAEHERDGEPEHSLAAHEQAVRR